MNFWDDNDGEPAPKTIRQEHAEEQAEAIVADYHAVMAEIERRHQQRLRQIDNETKWMSAMLFALLCLYFLVMEGVALSLW